MAVPKLNSFGFKYDSRRRFIKTNSKLKFIIEYQIRTRFMSGQFTINLMVNNYYERLAMIRPTLFSKFVNWIFGDYDPWWKDLFLPKDAWWKISPFQKEMDTIIGKTIKDLEAFGIAWFDEKLDTPTQESNNQR